MKTFCVDDATTRRLERELADIRKDLGELRTMLSNAWDNRATEAQCDAIRADIRTLEDFEDFAICRLMDYAAPWTARAKRIIPGAALLLVLSGCVTLNVTAPVAPHRCDWLNHSGVCETYAPLGDAEAVLARLRARDPGGDIVLGPHVVYPHLNDPHTPRK